MDDSNWWTGFHVLVITFSDVYIIVSQKKTLKLWCEEIEFTWKTFFSKNSVILIFFLYYWIKRNWKIHELKWYLLCIVNDSSPYHCLVYMEYGCLLTSVILQPTVPAAGKRAPRAGNIGHITRLVNKLVHLAHNRSHVLAFLQVGCV